MFLCAGFMVAAELAKAQNPLPPIAVPAGCGTVPGNANLPSKADMDQRYAALMERFHQWKVRADAFNQKYGDHEFDAGSQEAKDGVAEQAWLTQESRNYQNAVKAFNSQVESAKAACQAKDKNCEAAKRQADLDRAAIERQLATNEMNQEERAEWEKLSGEAQKQAVLASLSFVVGSYAEDLEPLRDSVSKLDKQAAFLAKKAGQSRKFSTRMKYIAQLQAAVDELKPMTGKLLAKEVAEKASDAEEFWYLAQNTLQGEFRVAAKRDQRLRDALKESGFKEAFTGDDLDTPGLDALSILAEKTLEETGNFALKLTKYEHYTGPAVNAAVFVRDAWYSAFLSAASAERVLQQNSVAADFARSAAVLQKQYKRSIDALRACREP